MKQTVIYNAHIVTPTQTVEKGAVWIENGKIVQLSQRVPASCENWQLIDAKQSWLLPAFVDLHIHGMGGFGPELGTTASLLELSKVLASQGVAAFCPTLYSASPKQLVKLIRQLLPAIGKETGARIIGFHLEGPFLSASKPGVMKSQDIIPPSLADFEKIYEAAQGKIAIMTLAPELPGIDPILKFCTQHNILMQAGHTQATYEQMQIAFSKGVKRVTHWGNAMSGLHQRAPGVLGAALINPDISCEVIADGKHVHPALLTLLREVKPISQITAVTDALLPTGQTQGPFMANTEEVFLEDGVWKRSKDDVTAGSALTMGKSFVQLLQCGYSPVQAVACTSTNAARLLGLPLGNIQVGHPANLLLMSKSGTPLEAELLLFNHR